MSNEKTVKPAAIPNVYDWIKLEDWMSESRSSAAKAMATMLDGRELNNFSYTLVELADKEQSNYGHPFSPEDLAWLRAEFGDELHVHYWW